MRHGNEFLADPEHGTLDGVVDLDRYPLESPDSRRWCELVDDVAAQLGRRGAASLPGFLEPGALAATADHLVGLAGFVPILRHRGSVYSRSDLEQDHSVDDPRRLEQEWDAGHVTRDMIPPYAASHRLYVSSYFKRFVAGCTGRTRVFEYADPLAGLVATVLPPGGRYPWHYDTNEFVVTITVQVPEAGGRFEYWRDLRRPGDENLEGLARVLAGGDRSGVVSLPSEPGDLQLFLGRYSLHRVTAVEGSVARHVLVLSYSDRPGVIGPVDRTRGVYGRVTEAHLVAAQTATGTDGLIL